MKNEMSTAIDTLLNGWDAGMKAAFRRANAAPLQFYQAAVAQETRALAEITRRALGPPKENERCP